MAGLDIPADLPNFVVRRATNEGRKPPDLCLSVYPLAQRPNRFPKWGWNYVWANRSKSPKGGLLSQFPKAV
jgi:hypothetical protein